jgi:type I restriction enzyme R subunit
VSDFLKESGDRFQKTIVFCVDTEHAARMRQALINENPDLAGDNPRYVVRITGDDEEGTRQLSNFIDPESRYPALVTTSRLLTTGVDAQTCRLIVLEREVGSMSEFKQIVGRGTRVHEDTGKFYFTLMDFRGATYHFADPAFDGEPVQIYQPGDQDPITPPEIEDAGRDLEEDEAPYDTETGETLIDGQPPDISLPPDDVEPRKKVYVEGVLVTVLAERVEYVDENGKLVTESLRDYTRKGLQRHFASLDDFLKRWKAAERKQAIIEELEKEGLLLDPLMEDVGKDLDPFDLICHVAFDRPPLTRRERAANVRRQDVFAHYGPQARAVLEALLDKYQDQGVLNLDDPGILKVAPFDRMGTVVQLIKPFGNRSGFEQAVHHLQAALYQEAA